MNRKMNHEKNFEMREIKFRAKDMSGAWVYGDIIHKRTAPGEAMIRCKQGIESDVDVDTIGQYTGLKDKNGKEIYEGDILKHSYWDRAPLDVYQQGGKDEYIEEILIVKYGVESGRYYSDLFTDIDMWICEDSEVIGNIYDNPELVEKRRRH